MKEYQEVANYHEVSGECGWVGVKILISTNRAISEDTHRSAVRVAQEITEKHLAEALRLNEERRAIRLRERADLVGAFVGHIFVEEIPNGYCSRWCCQDRPWFIVTTLKGRIKIGWRKRVISIDWSDSVVNETAEVLFPNENTTRIARSIHAWSLDDAGRYIWTILNHPAPEPK